MTQTPAGWYPDPQDQSRQRFWDGGTWTEQTAPGGSSYGGPAYVGSSYGGPPATPDGQPLAGWWRRVGASFIDGLISGTIGFVAAYPFWSNIFGAYGDYFDDVVDAADRGASTPSAMAVQSDILGDLVAVSLIALLVNLVYVVGFLAWKQGTPGKLALGMRVRLRDQPGPIPLGRILVRWVTQSGPSLLNVVPLVGTLASLYILLDSAWPLWDSKKQALHDKAAGTNVVMHVRR